LRASSFNNIVDDAAVTEAVRSRKKKRRANSTKPQCPVRIKATRTSRERTRRGSSATYAGVVDRQQRYTCIIFGLFHPRNKTLR